MSAEGNPPLAARLQQLADAASSHSSRAQATGVLVRVVGLALEAEGLNCALGSRCEIRARDGRAVEAEVVGFASQRTFLMPVARADGLQPGARVIPISHSDRIAVGPELLGRVIDGRGQPLDGHGALGCSDSISFETEVINPLQRRPIDRVLDTGIRAVNALLTVGQGQRLGLFAGSGVGKSVLLGMMTRFTSADVVVVGMVGERGREVREFIENILGAEGMRRAVVVAAPADEAPLLRLRSAALATRLAEYFRDRGQRVLLLVDSLTRYAQAQREIGLAIGEPPATKGYPPSVFARIPQLVERAGNAASDTGSITAFYTVLTEGDDLQDPVADAARAILDGHVVLSRTLADEGHYPAIDIEGSISRAMPNLVPANQLAAAQRLRRWYSRYQQNRDLIAVGAWSPGSDPETDEALRQLPAIREFLQQGLNEGVDYPSSVQQLQRLASRPPSAAVEASPPAAPEA